MKAIGRVFVRGLSTVLPVALTIAVLWWLGSKVEASLGGLLRFLIPGDYYVPGLGILAGAALAFVVGLFMHAWIARQIVSLLERWLEHVPLVKTVYGAFRDFASFFQQDAKEAKLGRPVLLEVGGSRLVGFVTAESAARLGLENQLVVYLPMSYQIGGYTVIVSPSDVQPIESMNTQDAMRYVLTAGLVRQKPNDQKERPAPPARTEP
jgi:uncharacterized membrane protein